MPKPTPRDSKIDILKEQGALNPRPEAVRDRLFQVGGFFDPRDLVQVKYEMLRRVQEEDASVTDASSAFGLSRVAFYQAQKRFKEEGLVGLLPRQRGPKQGHKLTDEVMMFLDQALKKDPAPDTGALVQLLKEHFGLSVHVRSIERALVRRQKKGR
jgi:transposase